MRSRQSPLPPKLLDQVPQRTEALELCVLALDVWCRSFPSRPFFFVAPEDRQGPASIWQLAEIMPIVKRSREATRSSAFPCELRAADSPPFLAFISNLCHLSSRLVQGWPRLELKGDLLFRHSCTCGQNHRKHRGIAHRGQFATQVLPLFAVGFWSTVLEATSKTLRDGVLIQKESDQECGDEAKAILEYSSSPWIHQIIVISSFGKFMASSFPALAGGSSHLLSSHPSPRVDPSVDGSSPMAPLSTTSQAEGNLEVGYQGYVSWGGWRGVHRW